MTISIQTTKYAYELRAGDRVAARGTIATAWHSAKITNIWTTDGRFIQLPCRAVVRVLTLGEQHATNR